MLNWRVLLLGLLRKGNLYGYYKGNLQLQYEGDCETIKEEMRRNAWDLFEFHVRNNPGYRDFLKDKGIDVSDLSKLKWENIPLMEKSDYKKYAMEVGKEVYSYSCSGGSTNAPFRYPLSKESALRLWPNHWVLHHLCGVEPCGRMLVLMGHSAKEGGWKKRVFHYLSNFYVRSAFDLTDEKVQELYRLVVKKKIKLIYGYSSAIYIFLKYLKKHDLHLQLKGIVSTSENVVPVCYSLARLYCGCEMYNQYGAHDGDIFSFECPEHAGLHVLHNYSTVEIVNGEVVLTAVTNRAIPFIRYKVGDRVKGGQLVTERCRCGRTLFRLEGIEGRTNVVVADTDGKEVPVIMFTFPLDEDDTIEKYQVVEKKGQIYINIVSEQNNLEYYEAKHLPYIKSKLKREVFLVMNQPLCQLPNKKVPLYYKYGEND